jgi:hypothetical protein
MNNHNTLLLTQEIPPKLVSDFVKGANIKKIKLYNLNNNYLKKLQFFF